MAVIRIAEPRVAPKTPPKGFALFELGFRPFFLLAAVSAALLVPLWIAVLTGALPLEPILPAMIWHGHEMVFGFAAAVIVGFLLTAAHNWTGLSTPSGWPLAALVVLWLAGRVVLFSEMPLIAAVVDVSFLLVSALVLARVLLRAGNRRNYFIPVLLIVLAMSNALNHAGSHGWLAVSPLTGLHLAVALVTILETVIAGRIVPSFTANALRTTPWKNTHVDRAAIAGTAIALGLWAGDAPSGLTGVVALVAGIAQSVRMWGWRPLATIRTPLLWVLHLSHGWIVVALFLLAAAGAGLVEATPVLHLLTVGGMGGLIIGMITRTAIGHTGRQLRIGRIETACYVLLQLSVILRVLPQFGLFGEAYSVVLWHSAMAWSACFALYVVKFAPILINPRVDGQPG